MQRKTQPRYRRSVIHKLRITGGEPLLRGNLPELIGDLSRIDGIDDTGE